MPIYEYHCKECGHYFDVWATIAEKEKGLDIACEKCGSKELHQVFAGISIATGASVTGNTRFGGGGCDPSAGCC
jgi:putative FmdB family regulatory protein